MIHVLPIDDTKPHEEEGTMCPCAPTVEWENAEAVVIHNAFDGREISEDSLDSECPTCGLDTHLLPGDEEMGVECPLGHKTMFKRWRCQRALNE